MVTARAAELATEMAVTLLERECGWDWEEDYLEERPDLAWEGPTRYYTYVFAARGSEGLLEVFEVKMAHDDSIRVTRIELARGVDVEAQVVERNAHNTRMAWPAF